VNGQDPIRQGTARIRPPSLDPPRAASPSLGVDALVTVGASHNHRVIASVMRYTLTGTKLMSLTLYASATSFTRDRGRAVLVGQNEPDGMWGEVHKNGVAWECWTEAQLALELHANGIAAARADAVAARVWRMTGRDDAWPRYTKPEIIK
jgi:hypothetical protein